MDFRGALLHPGSRGLNFQSIVSRKQRIKSKNGKGLFDFFRYKKCIVFERAYTRTSTLVHFSGTGPERERHRKSVSQRVTRTGFLFDNPR